MRSSLRAYHGGASALSLRADVLAARVLIWLAGRRGGRPEDLPPETHLFLFDRYQRLADHHRRRGRPARAERFQEKADAHARAGGDPGPPYAAAMGQPRPRAWIVTDAVSRIRVGGRGDAA